MHEVLRVLRLVGILSKDNRHSMQDLESEVVAISRRFQQRSPQCLLDGGSEVPANDTLLPADGFPIFSGQRLE
jgi:hypothetical protein